MYLQLSYHSGVSAAYTIASCDHPKYRYTNLTAYGKTWSAQLLRLGTRTCFAGWCTKCAKEGNALTPSTSEPELAPGPKRARMLIHAAKGAARAGNVELLRWLWHDLEMRLVVANHGANTLPLAASAASAPGSLPR